MVASSLPTGIEDLGAALEMLHTYSLIHDDLPALDNDDLRRGRPTCHKAFGEAIAILAGDALQTLAYEVLAQIGCPAEARVAIIREIAHATGTIDGMIGGQVVDLEAEHKKPDLATLEYIHRSKTAALITASVVSGGIYPGGTAADISRLRTYGQSIGLAFQIVDDVLDVIATDEQLGKPAGHDIAEGIYNLPVIHALAELDGDLRTLLGGPIAGADLETARNMVRASSGVERSITLARAYIDDAVEALAPLGGTPAAVALAGAATHLLVDVEAVSAA